mmetsp:Transcript_73972/g.163509  ORF Transcript_73972/g.163509 Transcript_73972/m.163509 type:complete len:586 (+) Transcript_73972:2090-3847(+)
MALNGIHRRRRNVRLAQGLRNEVLLAGRAGRRQACASIEDEESARDQAQLGLVVVPDQLIVHLLTELLTSSAADAIALGVAHGGLVEGLATTVAAAVPHDARPAQGHPRVGNQAHHQAHSAASDVVLLWEGDQGSLNSHHRRCTLRGDGDTGTHETQGEGETVGLDGRRRTGTSEHVGGGVLQGVFRELPFAIACSDIHTRDGFEDVCLYEPGASQALIDHLQAVALHRVHGDDLRFGDTELLAIEKGGAVHETTVFAGGPPPVPIVHGCVDVIEVPTCLGHLHGHIRACSERHEEAFRVPGAGEPARDAPDAALILRVVGVQMVLCNYPLVGQVVNLLDGDGQAEHITFNEDVCDDGLPVLGRDRHRAQPLHAVHHIREAENDVSLVGLLDGASTLLLRLGGVHLEALVIDDTPLLRDILLNAVLVEVVGHHLEPVHGPSVDLPSGRAQGQGCAAPKWGRLALRHEPASQCDVVGGAGHPMVEHVRAQKDHAANLKLDLDRLGFALLSSIEVFHLKLDVTGTQELQAHDVVPHELLQPPHGVSLPQGHRLLGAPLPRHVKHSGAPPAHLKAQEGCYRIDEGAHG